MTKKITALTAQKKNHERVNVYLDGEFAFGLARIVSAWLQVGQELSEEKIASLQSADSLEAAYQNAIRFLSYRDRTEAEVSQHLRQKGVPEELISQVLDRLHHSKLIDDQRFAKRWVENRSEFRPRSRRALDYELQRKGVQKQAIQQALESFDEDEMAYRAVQKQYRKFQNLEWPEFRRKMVAFLARRGFTYETTAPIVARVWAEHSPSEAPEDILPYEEVER